MLGRVLVMGCPWQPTRLMYAGTSPRSFRITLPVYARRENTILYVHTYSVHVTLSVGCTTTRTTTLAYNGEREVRFVCVHTRGRVNWFRLGVRWPRCCHSNETALSSSTCRCSTSRHPDHRRTRASFHARVPSSSNLRAYACTPCRLRHRQMKRSEQHRGWHWTGKRRSRFYSSSPFTPLCACFSLSNLSDRDDGTGHSDTLSISKYHGVDFIVAFPLPIAIPISFSYIYVSSVPLIRF